MIYIFMISPQTTALYNAIKDMFDAIEEHDISIPEYKMNALPGLIASIKGISYPEVIPTDKLSSIEDLFDAMHSIKEQIKTVITNSGVKADNNIVLYGGFIREIVAESNFEIKGPESPYRGKYLLLTCLFNGQQVNADAWNVISGSKYVSFNEFGRIDIIEGTESQEITVEATYTNNTLYTAEFTIEVSYDNQFVIQCADTMVGENGNCIALFNDEVVEPEWSIKSDDEYATINASGEISIKASGNITVFADYSKYTATKDITLVYQEGATTETIIDGGGSTVTTTTTVVTDPSSGSTTTETTSVTIHEDGSQIHVETTLTENEDGSSYMEMTETMEDGSLTNTTTEVSSPDPETGSVTSITNTTNYNSSGEATGSTDNTTIENTDGSYSSTTTNYDGNGDPISGVNETQDADGNNHQQDLAYDSEGNSSVCGYTIDTSNNPEGEEDMTGTGVNTQYIPFYSPNGFVMHIKFKTIASEQPEPPLVEDTEDSSLLYNIISAKSTTKINKVWPGFDIRWGGSLKNRVLQFRRTLVGETSSNATNITTRHVDNVYDLTITYNPKLANNKFTVQDNWTGNTIVQVNKNLQDNINLELTLGYALNMQGEPYRYANVSILEFYVYNI